VDLSRGFFKTLFLWKSPKQTYFLKFILGHILIAKFLGDHSRSGPGSRMREPFNLFKTDGVSGTTPIISYI
jgi:hypothetical protein